MASVLDTLKIILPKAKAKKVSTSTTSTFSGNGQVIGAPQYREHLDDVFESRIADNSRDLLEELFIQDPDVSAAVNAYLTVANTEPCFTVTDVDGQIDLEGAKTVDSILKALSTTTDYSLKFQRKESLKSIAEGLRYMLLLRGAIGAELVFDKFLVPTEVRNVDMKSILWFEPKAGVFKPEQEVQNGDNISLDIPNFFVKTYRQNPAKIYNYSPFVSSINTIAARQQVINDLYRIMQKTGYPRIDVQVMEDILIKAAPESVRTDADLQTQWVTARINEITTQINNLRADSAMVHTDASEIKVFNEGGPKSSLDVSAIINVLNSSNQAALKTMGTIIGRGESGVNTASVEARIFTMSADELNEPVSDILSEMLTFVLRMLGSESIVKLWFKKAEMRPELELESHYTMKQQRYKDDLSIGLISDEKYHRDIYNQSKPDGIQDFSGTNFLDPVDPLVDATKVSPNDSPLNKSLTPKGGKKAKSN
jgi:hypothetical protein